MQILALKRLMFWQISDSHSYKKSCYISKKKCTCKYRLRRSECSHFWLFYWTKKDHDSTSGTRLHGNSTVPSVVSAFLSNGRGHWAWTLFEISFRSDNVKFMLMNERLSCNCDGFLTPESKIAGAHVNCDLADCNLERICRLFGDLLSLAQRWSVAPSLAIL